MRVWFNKTFSSIHSALSLIREADARGEFRLIVSHANPCALALQAAHERSLEPSGMTGEAYIEWCLKFCEEKAVDVFIPGKEATLAARRHSDFERCGTLLLSAAPPEMLEIMNDKALFYATAQSEDAPVPESKVFHSLETFNEAWNVLREHHSVLCVKPANSVFGLGFGILSNTWTPFEGFFKGDKTRIGLDFFRQMLKSEARRFPKMLLMPFLNGDEYSVDCVALRGELICHVARLKPRNAAGYQLIVEEESIARACESLTKQFQLNGIINIQFRKGNEGLKTLEINPRPSGGVGKAALSGINLPYIALNLFVHPELSREIPKAKTGLKVSEFDCPVILEEAEA